MPTGARGARVADAEGRVAWEDGTSVGTVRLPVAVAIGEVFLDLFKAVDSVLVMLAVGVVLGDNEVVGDTEEVAGT